MAVSEAHISIYFTGSRLQRLPICLAFTRLIPRIRPFQQDIAMLLPTQLPCRQAKERKGPCPHLVNGRQCRSQSCRQRSYHDYQQIQWWKQNPGKSRCQKGSNCAHLQTRTCLWTHPPEDQALQAQLKELMTRGLTYKETLDTTRLLELSQGFISISDHCDLASFNKVSSTEIAVPGV
jgi:hypothetical protein